MNRRTVVSFAAAVVCAVVLLMGGASATAQQNLNLCEYRITLDGDGSGFECSPVQLLTKWQGVSVNMQSLPLAGNFQLQVPDPANCPPAHPFQWVRINGAVGSVGIGDPEATMYYGEGCCAKVRMEIDTDGYVHIYVSPC